MFEAQIQVCWSFIRLQLAMIQTSMPADLHFTLNVNTQSVRELKIDQITLLRLKLLVQIALFSIVAWLVLSHYTTTTL